jgi:hypothetical protein
MVSGGERLQAHAERAHRHTDRQTETQTPLTHTDTDTDTDTHTHLSQKERKLYSLRVVMMLMPLGISRAVFPLVIFSTCENGILICSFKGGAKPGEGWR